MTHIFPETPNVSPLSDRSLKGLRPDLLQQGTADDDDDTATTQEQQHAGWRSTYSEHVPHVRHLAHVPIADGLIEGLGILQRSEGRAAVRSERRPRSEGIGDG